MKRLFGRTFFLKTRGAGLGATASILLTACVVDDRSPELCDSSVPERSAKCQQQPAYGGGTGGERGTDY